MINAAFDYDENETSMPDELAAMLNKELEDGLSIRALARKIGVSDSTARHALSGDPVAPRTLKKVARYLKLPDSEVFRMAGLLPKKPATQKNIDLVVHLFSQLPEEYQSRLLDRLKFELELIQKEMRKDG
jgi:transcriptional regulator with XRE-family HTH domain